MSNDETRWLLCGLSARAVEAARSTEVGSHARSSAHAAWDSIEDWLLLPLMPGMLPLPDFVLHESTPSWQRELERSTPRTLVRVHPSLAAASAIARGLPGCFVADVAAGPAQSRST